MKERFSEFSRVLDVLLQQKAIQEITQAMELPEAIPFLFSEFSLVRNVAPTDVSIGHA
jgi:hypothetical protein